MSKRLFLRAAGAAMAGAALQACGGGGGGGSGGGGGGGCSAIATGSSTLLQLVQNDSRFSTLNSAVSRAASPTLGSTLADTAARLTLFAPDNSAFDTLASRLGAGSGTQLVAQLTPAQWESILQFHVLSQAVSRCELGTFAANDTRPATLYRFRTDPQQLIFVNDGGQFNVWDGVGRSSITLSTVDVAASNGVLHVTSDPLLPRGVLTILQMLRANVDAFSDFGQSAAATNAALLNGTAKYTVFVPSQQRVTGAASLNSSQVRRHIVSGEIDDLNLTDGLTITPLTITGGNLTLRKSTVAGAERVTLNSGTTLRATVTDVDFWASNGVIHVVDAIIP